MQRRAFLAGSIGAAAAGLAGCRPRLGDDRRRILVLGGTNFVGPAIVERALARGHSVTLFNRGITRPHLFPSIEKLRGDRSRGSEELGSLGTTRRWDAVIDVWPEESGLVDRTAQLLANRTDYYFFVSSISVYRNFRPVGIAESDDLRLDMPGTYGGEKALAEGVLEAALPGRHGIARCHAIVGPRDDGTALHYWLRRLAEEEKVLAPGSGADAVQYVDVRDAAQWIVDCVERGRLGAHNLCGPAQELSLRGFLQEVRDGIGSRAQLSWIDRDFLREQGIQSFTDMPFWVPEDEDPGFYRISSNKAVSAGMRYRPLRETVEAAWNWYRSHFFKDTAFPSGGMGISREREVMVLDAWDAHRPR